MQETVKKLQSKSKLIKQLKQELFTLQKLKDIDFRDVELWSPEWDTLFKCPSKREQMQAWIKGPLLAYGPLSTAFKERLQRNNELTHTIELPLLKNLSYVLTEAERRGFCRVYFQGFPITLIKGINELAKREGYNLRCIYLGDD